DGQKQKLYWMPEIILSLNLFLKKLFANTELQRLYSLIKEETLLAKLYGYYVKSFLSNINSLHHTTHRPMEWLKDLIEHYVNLLQKQKKQMTEICIYLLFS